MGVRRETGSSGHKYCLMSEGLSLNKEVKYFSVEPQRAKPMRTDCSSVKGKHFLRVVLPTSEVANIGQINFVHLCMHACMHVCACIKLVSNISHGKSDFPFWD